MCPSSYLCSAPVLTVESATEEAVYQGVPEGGDEARSGAPMKRREASRIVGIHKPKDSGGLFYLGVYWGDQKHYEEALVCFDQVISLQEDFAGAWNNKGVTLTHLHRYEEALEAHDKAISLEGGNPDYWDGKGVALAELGRLKEALACFEQAISLVRPEKLVLETPDKRLEITLVEEGDHPLSWVH
jgi:tetratricopeptide (TPR) repeat protein